MRTQQNGAKEKQTAGPRLPKTNRGPRFIYLNDDNRRPIKSACKIQADFPFVLVIPDFRVARNSRRPLAASSVIAGPNHSKAPPRVRQLHSKVSGDRHRRTKKGLGWPQKITLAFFATGGCPSLGCSVGKYLAVGYDMCFFYAGSICLILNSFFFCSRAQLNVIMITIVV